MYCIELYTRSIYILIIVHGPENVSRAHRLFEMTRLNQRLDDATGGRARNLTVQAIIQRLYMANNRRRVGTKRASNGKRESHLDVLDTKSRVARQSICFESHNGNTVAQE